MSDTPKFTVIDRRKFHAEDEQETAKAVAKEPVVASDEPSPGPRLVVNESKKEAEAEPARTEPAAIDVENPEGTPPAPTADESREQRMAYEVAAQRLDDIIRAQNPGMGKQPPITFEHLVQQFYMSAMLQMGAGAQEGQRPRVDIVGARTTIDLLGVLAQKTRENLTESEERLMESVLFEVRMAFLELTSMISVQGMQPPQAPPPGKR